MTIKQQILKRYREIHPKSRAQDYWTFARSTGSEHKATCIFCREVIVTCSGKFPTTKTFYKKADKHCEECAMMWYCNGQIKDLKQKLNK